MEHVPLQGRAGGPSGTSKFQQGIITAAGQAGPRSAHCPPRLLHYLEPPASSRSPSPPPAETQAPRTREGNSRRG